MMKKIIALLLALALIVLLAACSSGQEEPPSSAESQISQPSESQSSDVSDSTSSEAVAPPVSEESDPPAEQAGSASEPEGESRVLVAYFSWADNAVIEGEVDAVASPSVVAPGNVQQLAGWVQERTGGDLFSIRVTDPYPSDWDECLARANRERADNLRPELTESVADMADYDVVFLGYPNWWYGAPMALLSFIEQNDLSGKEIYLFCSHGTGGLAGSVDDIQSVLPESAILSENVFDVYEEDAPASQNDILSWLSEVGY